MASPAPASPDVYTSPEELAEEIEYQKVLLLSLDDMVQDREQAEAEIKAEITKLEKQLKALRQGQHNPMASTGGSMPSAYDDDPFGQFQTNISLNPVMRGPSSTSSTPNSAVSAAVFNSLLSPSQSTLPTRKRSHREQSGYADSDMHLPKIKRTTPSPYATRPTTPSSCSVQDLPLAEDGFYDLTGGEDAVDVELTKSRQRQIAAEAKANRERDDAEYARRLQAELSGNFSPPGLTTYSSQPARPIGQSAFDRILGRNHVDYSQAAFGRNLQGPGTFPSVKNLSGPASTPSFNGINIEPNKARRDPMPGIYHESDSDSDIEFIPSSAFSDNGRHSSFTAANLLESANAQRNSYSNPMHAQSSSAAETARRAALHRMQFLDQQQSYYTNPQLHSLATPTQPGAMGVGPTLNGGLNLPRPFGMDAQASGYAPYSNYNGAAGSSVYPNSLTPSTFPSSAGLSGPGSMSNNNPLSHLFATSSGFNFDSMIDIYGNPLDPRMLEINTALGGRLSEITDYVHDPRRTAQEIQDLLENIRPDVEIPKENREGTPDGLKYALYEHQKLALTWLKQMEEGTNKGGILADDMGLGKTISAIALILSRPSEDRKRRTTLIVGPVALVRQWEREFQTKVKRSHRLSTFLYHSGRKASWDTLRNFDIVFTTYGTIGAELKRKETWHRKCMENSNLDPNSMRNKFPFLGDDSLWYRVILDEAQCIKNKNTKAAQAACQLKSKTRFCLTGTPMMNGVHELYSLIHFLRIKPYNEYTRFTADFGCLSRAGGSRGSTHPNMEKNAMKKLQAVLKAMLLRRTKTSKIDGKPILELPEKTEVIDHAIFNEDEQAYYTALETKTRLVFNKYVKAGTVGKNYSNILVLLLRLRQAACHPHLIMDFEEAPPEAATEDMVVWAKSLAPDVIRRIVEATFPFECPVCYDPVPNPRIVIPCGHDTCSECLVRIAGNVEQEAIAEGNEVGHAKCPTCRGKIDMGRIIDYDTFKQVHMSDRAGPTVNEDDMESEDDGDSIDLSSESNDGIDSESESDGSDKDIRDFIVPDDYVSEKESSADDDEDDDWKFDVKGKSVKSTGFSNSSTKVKKEETIKNEVKEDKAIKNEIKEEETIKNEFKEEGDDSEEFVEIKDIKPAKRGLHQDEPRRISKKAKKLERHGESKGKRKLKSKPKENAKETSKQAHFTLAMLKKEAMKSKEGRRRYMRYLRKNFVSSAKVDKCLEILRNTEPDIKTIIFSQFTTLLDLVEVPIRQEKWGFMRYDGSMSAEKRHHAVVNFTDEPQCKVMLVSLKAGNAGLNLVAASQVIILDPFWNPFIEMQAVDRAHRIGQQKPVQVHRILIAGTVEDRIIELQNKKRKLVEAALDEKASQGLGRLGRQELIYLFNGGAERETAPRLNDSAAFGADASPASSASI